MSYVPHGFEINTLGAAEASKFLTVDSNIDVASGLRNLTASGYLQGTTSLRTALIEYTDGDDAITIADGGGVTMAAGITSTAASNTLGATSFSDGNITNVGDIALDSISADGTDINLALTDNSATAFTIKQGSDAYLIVDTANSSESVSIGTGISGTAITIGHATSETTIADNLTVTGDFTVNGTTTTVNSTIVTVDDKLLELAHSPSGSEGADTDIVGGGIVLKSSDSDKSITWVNSTDSWTFNQGLDVSDLNIINVGDIDCDSISIADAATGLDIVFGGNTTLNKISLTDNLADALNINEGGTSYLKFVTTNSSEQIVFGKNSTFASTTIADLGTVTTANIDGGTIDGTTIGASSHTTGKFTTVDATTDFTIDGLVITADTITNDAVLEVVSTGLTLNASLDIALSADGGNVTMDDGTTTAFDFNVDDVELKIHDDAQVANYCSIAVGNNGATTITTVDADAAAANLIITADGTVDIDSAGVLTLDSGAAINIEPAAGSAILLDGTISIDAGVVTGATSITSTNFVGIIGASGAAAGTFTTLSCNAGAFAIVGLDIDGGTDIGEAIVDGDLFIVDNGADGTNRKCAASRLKTYISGLTVDTSHTSDGEVLGSDVNLYSQAATRTLDLPSAAVAGDVIYIKNNAASHVLTVATEGSETIDGSATKILYHQYESLTVVSDGSNWHII